MNIFVKLNVKPGLSSAKKISREAISVCTMYILSKCKISFVAGFSMAWTDLTYCCKKYIWSLKTLVAYTECKTKENLARSRKCGF